MNRKTKHFMGPGLWATDEIIVEINKHLWDSSLLITRPAGVFLFVGGASLAGVPLVERIDHFVSKILNRKRLWKGIRITNFVLLVRKERRYGT